MNNYISVMIVEDEKLILEDLLTIVPWEALGFKVVATAINGEIGLRMFEKYNPQLILTDIKMPVFDGLAMMKSIKQFNPSVHFMIISSYSDFEYAQIALRLGATDYILKGAITPEYIKEKLDSVKTALLCSNELYLNLYCRMLEDLLTARFTISPGDVTSLIERIDTADLEQNLSMYIDKSIAIVNKYMAAYLPDASSGGSTSQIPKDIESLKAWLFHKISFIQENHQLYFEKKLSPSIINAYNYISENYGNPNLRINEIADAVGLSPSRLSVLFKQEVGKTVNDILTDKRIEQAKYLLRWKRLKVYEVSDQVGYKTSQYFSKVFYQYTGQYPNNYRESDN